MTWELFGCCKAKEENQTPSQGFAREGFAKNKSCVQILYLVTCTVTP